MASRLSTESLKKVYDHGHQGFFRQEKSLEIQSIPDVQSMVLDDNKKNLIQALPPQSVYQAFSALSGDEAAEVFRLLSSEQWGRICDYSVWVEDDLHPNMILTWLELAPKIERSTRFQQLEEELQMSMLSGLIRAFEAHELEDMTDDQQDVLTWFPGREMAYQVLSEDPEVCRQVHELLDSMMHDNMAYTMSALMGATWLPPGEQEALARQFRAARIAEDGFVSWDDSQRLFTKLDPSHVSHAVASVLPTTELKNWAQENFLRDFIKNLDAERQAFFMQQCTTLANGLCTASGLEVGDIRGQQRVFRHGMGLVALGLEQLSHGDLEKSVQLLDSSYVTQWFQVGLWHIEQLQERLLKAWSRFGLDVEKLRRAARSGRFGVAVSFIEKSLLDILGYERCEKAKALWNRYPMVPQEQKAGQIYFKSLDGLTDYVQLSQMVDEWVVLCDYLQQQPGFVQGKPLDLLVQEVCLKELGETTDFAAAEMWLQTLDPLLKPAFQMGLAEIKLQMKQDTEDRGE